VSNPSTPGARRPLTAKQQRQLELASIDLRPALRPTKPVGAIVLMLSVLAVLWAVVGIDAALDHRLLRFGIKARQLGGLWGVLTDPVLHADISQLATNTIPLAVFGWIMLISGGRFFVIVTAVCWLVSGLVSWVAGPSNTIVLGASGLVFGWLGYVLARAWFSRKLMWIGIAVAILCVFSSMLTGLAPSAGHHTFWGGQLAGFLSGIGMAALLHRKRKQRRSATGPALP
jgi:membrane associated rhomboid family serine protease